jgi:hypothetical protein
LGKISSLFIFASQEDYWKPRKENMHEEHPGSKAGAPEKAGDP